jgi:Na+/melibiose symporter-like transporter
MIDRQSAHIFGGLAIVLIQFAANPAFAYIGPGAGLTAIGTFFGVVGAVVLLIVGFLWYPVKRMLRRGKQQPLMAKSDSTQQKP